MLSRLCFEPGSLTGLRLICQTRLIGQQALGIHSSPCWDYRLMLPCLAFYMSGFRGWEESSSDLGVCTASNVAHQSSPHSRRLSLRPSRYSFAIEFWSFSPDVLRNKAGKAQERVEEKQGWISQGAEVCTFHDKALFLVQSR